MQQSYFPSLDSSNQILNEGEPLKELSYLTDYVKDKMLLEEERERARGQKQRPPSTAMKKSQSPAKNLYHHSHSNQQATTEIQFGDEKNISLNFQQKYYQQQPNKNNSDNIIFYDNKSYSTQRLSDFKRNFKRRITETEDIRILNRSDNEPSTLASSTKLVNGGVNKVYNHRLNNFSETSSVELTPMLLRSQKSPHNRTFNSKSSHHQYQDLSGVSGSHPYDNNNVAVTDSMDQQHQQQQQPTLMELECIAGYDGGLPQYFFLEAYDSRTRKLRLNITSALNDVPLFRIDLASMCLDSSKKKW